MEASRGLEIEKKYDVDSGAAVPALEQAAGVARTGKPHTDLLEAVYFDTPRHALAARRITLRRRTGGKDAGWHLKLPPQAAAAGEGPQHRTELHAPLGRPDVVPDALLTHLQAYLRGAVPVPVVRLETRRTTYPLYGDDGVHLADLADDQVTAERLQDRDKAAVTRQQWREWELELVHGDPGLFGPVEELLAAAGARPAGHASKLARALGDDKRAGKAAAKRSGAGGESAGQEATSHETAGQEAGSGEAGGPAAAESSPALVAGKRAPAAAVVTVYVGGQIEQILARDAAVRGEEPGAVHAMRSAARRIRSVLGAYGRLYRASPVRKLRSELKWLGQLLGQPRDAEVLREQLREQLAGLPAGEGVAAATTRLEERTGGDYDAAFRLLQEALGTDRYFRLLDKLEDFRDNPPVRAQAVVPGRRAAAKAVDKAAKRLRRSRKAAKQARRGMEQELALHRVRKDAKRLRHVAESAALVHGKRAGKVAKAARRQQKILGRFQDAVVARDLLAGVAADGTDAATAGIYAQLRSQQEERMLAAQADFRKAWKKARDLLGHGVI
ncbi:CYTH and CHAD domain-containing protein [Pseudarthrobacter sp. BRE9]|uniref:CYTH and CHAD domain-containing protein n=1 Tax=Pseudarthrobacter sp. BRE9 TaxID=2962582 RepID=UPI002880D23B|nr:CYTH and CHAD domain-containing protein [Pseudarthrobacter sp. BRE9]MDT0167996.1 CYTH and CHAD domain-containing protein [Pseudarthrobacter sp. BRE9]